MVIERRKNLEYVVIDTGKQDPIMILGLMRAMFSEMYDIILDEDRVIIHRKPCIA